MGRPGERLKYADSILRLNSAHSHHNAVQCELDPYNPALSR